MRKWVLTLAMIIIAVAIITGAPQVRMATGQQSEVMSSTEVLVTATPDLEPGPGPQPEPEPPGPVGGEAYPVNKLLILAPWIALFAAIVAGAIIVRRRRSIYG
jgi:hypothetical protein